MRVCIFAGGFSTTLSAWIMPLAQMLKNFNVHCDIVTPFPWEFVAEGQGYGVDALMHSEKLKSIFMHRRLREYPVTGASTLREAN